ncbi:MAG: AAA family ATPase [Acidimicrobiales bacterium]
MGRAAILEELGRRRDAALADQPQLCLLHGVAGAGKTAVLHAFLQAWPNAAAGAGTVLWAAGTRHEASTGYAVLSQPTAGSWRLLDTERPRCPPPAGVEVLGLGACSMRCSAVASCWWPSTTPTGPMPPRPRCCSPCGGCGGIAVDRAGVPTEEAGDAWRFRAPCRRSRRAGRASWAAGLDEVGRLAQRHGCGAVGWGAARLAAHTAGNPLSVIELARTLTAAEIERAPLLPAPRSIDAAVRHRLATLSEPARRLATAAAVLGERCTLAAASSLGEVADAVSAAAEAARLSLLGTEGNGAATTVHFVHPLFESAVYSALGVDERTALHRRAASLAAPENEQLRHLRAAATGPDPALAARIAERAGSEMARAAPAAAAEWYLAAAELAGSDGDRERWRWLAVHALIQGGEIRRAAWAAAETAPAGPATAFRRYVEGTLSLLRGDGAAAGLALEQGWALAAGGPTMADPALAATIAAQLGLVALVLDDVEGVRRWAHRSVRAAEAGGVTEHLGQVLVAYGAWWDGRADEALAGCALLDELDAEAQLTTAIDARNGRLLLRLWTDDEAGVRADAAIMERSLRRYGPSVYGAISLANLAELEYRLGNWDAGLAGSEAAVSLGADLGHSWHAVCYPVAAATCAARGQWDHADRYVAAVRAAAHRNGDPGSRIHLDSVEAAAAFARGELVRLLDTVRPPGAERDRSPVCARTDCSEQTPDRPGPAPAPPTASCAGWSWRQALGSTAARWRSQRACGACWLAARPPRRGGVAPAAGHRRLRRARPALRGGAGPSRPRRRPRPSRPARTRPPGAAGRVAHVRGPRGPALRRAGGRPSGRARAGGPRAFPAAPRGAHPAGGGGGTAGGRRSYQQGGGGRAVPQREDRRVPPRPRVRQARHTAPYGAGPPGPRSGVMGADGPGGGAVVRVRRAEAEVLAARLAAAGNGRGGAVAVVGEAGAGKTWLCAGLGRVGLDHRFGVVSVRAVASETTLTYGALHDVLEPLLDRSSILTEAHRRVLLTALGYDLGPPVEPLTLRVAALALLAAAAAARPLLVIVDDAHWLDEASWAVLQFCARRLAHDPVLLVFSMRPRPDRRPPADASGPDGTEVLELGPLPDPEREAVVRAVAGDGLSGAAVEAIVASSGNPLVLAETARAAAGLVGMVAPMPAPMAVGAASPPLFGHRIDALPAGHTPGARRAPLTRVRPSTCSTRSARSPRVATDRCSIRRWWPGCWRASGRCLPPAGVTVHAPSMRWRRPTGGAAPALTPSCGRGRVTRNGRCAYWELQPHRRRRRLRARGRTGPPPRRSRRLRRPTAGRPAGGRAGGASTPARAQRRVLGPGRAAPGRRPHAGRARRPRRHRRSAQRPCPAALPRPDVARSAGRGPERLDRSGGGCAAP